MAMNERRKKEFEKNVEALFGKDFDNLSEEELVSLYNRIRIKLRNIYTKSFPTEWKVCDNCNHTYPPLTDNCGNCGGKLRTFTVDPSPRFMHAHNDILADGELKL